MNKKVIVILSIILLVVLSILIVVIHKTFNTSKKLELTYETNAGVPYKWEYEIEDPTIVKFYKKYELENENKNGLVGGKISTNYVFKGLRRGKTTITFKYIDIRTKKVEKEEKLNIRVDKFRNISLVTIPKD